MSDASANVSVSATAQASTAEEGAKADETSEGVDALYREALNEYKAGKIDIGTLNDRYEHIAIKFPIAGSFVAAKEELFAYLDKTNPALGRAVRTIYGGIETGARTGAALSAQAALLAASNYGAAPAGVASAAALLGAAAYPIGLGVAVGSILMTFLGGGHMSPEEALLYAENLAKSRKEAIRILWILNDGKHSGERWIAEHLGVLAQLENLREYPFVRSRLEAGTLHVNGWVFDISSGAVFDYEPEEGEFKAIAAE